MALKIGLSSYVSAGFVNPVRWDLYEDVSSILIDSHSENGPHGVIYNFDWSNGIRDIAYRIEFYDVPGGAGIGNLIKSHVVTPSTQTLIFDTDIELIVDGGLSYDPVSATDTVVIPALIGKDYYVVQRGIGQLRAQRDVEIIPDLINGGFQLTGGQTFNPADTFIVKIRPQYVVNPPGSQLSVSIYKDVVFITTDTTLTSLDFGKLLIVDADAKVVTLQLPAKATIVKKVPLWIKSVGTNHVNVVIRAANTETITASATTSQTFILGRAEEAQVIRYNDTLFGFTDSIDIKRAGQIEWGYGVGLNRLWADGNASAPGAIDYLVADYPRLKKAMDAMSVGQVVTYTLWNSSVEINGVTVYPYKGYYAISNDGVSFKVPDWRNRGIRALRYSDNTVDEERLKQPAGGYQHFEIQSHGHKVGTTGNQSGVDPGKAIQRAATAPDAYQIGAQVGEPYIEVTGGIETREANNGMIPLIIT